MSTPTPMRAGDVVVGCVTEDNPKYLAQTLRLLQSIRWFGGELGRARVVVGAVEHIDIGARRSLEALDAEIRIIPEFHSRWRAGNRLHVFRELETAAESHLLVLDCDMIVVRDPLPLLQQGVFQSRIAPLPTVTHEVFERLFEHFGIPLPPRSHRTGYTDTPTIPYFNAGMLSMPRDVAPRFVPQWLHYNKIFADNPSLVAPCEKHLHQAALAMALAETGTVVEGVGAELNYQLNMTQFPAPPGYLEIDPYIVHYHHLVAEDGTLLPCPFPVAQERIDAFNERLREERARSMRVHRPRPVNQSPRQVAVLGMHRSGTSAVARLLHAMGCHAGDGHDLAPPDVFHPTGYWEHRGVWALDEEILAALGATWLEPARADLAGLSDEERSAFVARARAIAESLDAHGTWMIKDPRLSILFPIWREALDHPVCVLVWREPAQVAGSLAKRDALLLPLGLALWEEYTRAMLDATRGLPRVCVSYQDLVRDPVGCAAKLHRDLAGAGATDLQLPPDEELRGMVDPALNRHAGENEELLQGAQRDLRDALRDGTALQWDVVPPIHPATRQLLAMFLQQQREIPASEKRTNELAQLLAAVFESRSWRIGFGLNRLWRAVKPSSKQTALDRWHRHARSDHR